MLKSRNMKWVLPLALAALLGGLNPTFAQKQTYTLTLSTWGTPKHPQVSVFIPKFMDLANKASNGQLKFKYFPSGEMVKEAFVNTAVPNDTVDISLTTLDNWVGRVPAVGITETPLWTFSMGQDQTGLEPGKPLFEYFKAALAKQNVLLLALFDVGPAVATTTFPLHNPADLKGKVIRAVSKGSAQVIKALNASPVVMSIGDVYSALQRRTIDGAFSGVAPTWGLRYYEVAKYLMGTNGLTGTFVNGYVMNLAKFNSLPENVQKALLDAAAQARDEMQDAMIKAYGNFLKKLGAHGMAVFVPQSGSLQWAAWQAALKPFKEQAEKQYPATLVRLVTDR